jgi:hypothetical protein
MTIAQEIAAKFTTMDGYLTNIRNSLTTKSGSSQSSTPMSGMSAVIDNISPAWDRPADWYAMPTIPTNDQKCIILYNITQQMYHASFTCAAAYTVDWGDSVVENFSSGVTAQHTYTFANLTQTLANGQKQALISITPQAGQNLTSIDLTSLHSAYPAKSWISGAVEVSINAQFLTTLTLQTVTANRSKLFWLQSFGLHRSALTTANQLFSECYNLKHVSAMAIPNTVTNFSYMFRKCYSLTSMPLFDTSGGTTFSNMFNSCYSLTTIPQLNTSNGTDFSSMFSQCYSLKTIPLIDTAKGLNLSSMFGTCSSLISVPQLNTILCTNFSSMFSLCPIIVEVPILNMIAATNVTSMFSTCTYLQGGRMLNTPISISYASCNLYRDGIVDIFNGLPTVTNSSTITITGNPGVSSLTGPDNAIATGKGWTIITV